MFCISLTLLNVFYCLICLHVHTSPEIKVPVISHAEANTFYEISGIWASSETFPLMSTELQLCAH